MAPPNDADREKVLWCGNLHESVTEEILYELFLQVCFHVVPTLPYYGPYNRDVFVKS